MSAAVGSGGILQVHPTRRCNLSCVHCYSSSSPREPAGLAPDILCQAVEDGAALGFDIVSLSGGEPLLYHALGDLLATARNVGCRVNLVSNGILIGSSRYERCADAFGLIALSLDGLPDRHNTIRGSSSSFEHVRAAAQTLRRDGVPFGIIHTLTSESLDELEELGSIVADWGAALLQLHPFETAGRGVNVAGMTPLSEQDRVVAYVLASSMARLLPLKVQLDLVHRDVARHVPQALQGERLRSLGTPHQLVIQDDGVVVPLSYGLSAAWAVTDLKQERLGSAWKRYLETRWIDLRRVMRLAAIEIARGRHGEVAEWHSVVRRRASVVK